ncbi:DNA gyrase inhibitor YacG [Microvirga guangxiensis]|uniref:DNA gyrase inhibitor YacG n=1 Tax=Microvirga guangxiensis TaxID=549386 RepID=A0A1G5BV61_9HYPH|nr:DNA gyrase inhibitor YacG [Microvirga guangxiensis]SCX93944.1 hypothetical protein SAMN02927923_00353 [Microvirga guangxiensis]
MDPANENTPKAPAGKCPICGKPTVMEYKPFCSKRCADVDLNRWLSGTYAIPAVDDPEDRGEDDREDTE